MRHLLFLPIVICLSACGAGDGSGLDENGQPTEQPPTQPPGNNNEDGIKPTLESIQEEVFTPICSACHIGANAPLGLQLDTLQNSIDNLINVAAQSNAQFNRVSPGNAQDSFLYMKVVGDARAGNQMPLGQAPLTSEAQQAIKDWIENGAVVANNSQRLSIRDVSTARTQGVLEFTLTFSVDVDPTSLSPNQLSWQPDFLVPQAQLSWQSSRILTIQVTDDSALKLQTLSLNQAHLGTVQGLNGQVLDGNNDRQPGGEFRYEIPSN